MKRLQDKIIISTNRSIGHSSKNYLWLWLLWLSVFYLCWVSIVYIQDQWQTVTEHWPIAVAMALGSYAAGSTPMGGGTVGFPVLVLIFDMPATIGRDFSFAIQAIGMTSASIFILARRQTLALSTLYGAMLGSLIGTPLGIFFVAPLIPELWIKIVFAVIWASFGLLHLYRIKEITQHRGMTEFNERWDFRLGIYVGFLAAISVVSVTGVGIDMLIYSVLILLCRADLKIAIPTSVIIMAFTSVIGVIVKALSTGFSPGVYENWLAAAPVVALGAPLGVFIVSIIGRKPTLFTVSAVCALQYVWTCMHEYELLGIGGVFVSLMAIALLLCAFEALRKQGLKLIGTNAK